ncbi:MAG: LysM peptidoglycan-binding domain-containing protein [Clostridia bacterium]|nr:LysM peptidoglycan-binding domain-containing protein [Clostridia bacterium]
MLWWRASGGRSRTVGTPARAGQSSVTVQQEVPPCPNGQLYSVRPGDTLFVLARRFGVSVEAILAANPQITDPDRLAIGQTICIPGAPAPTVCPRGFFYTVRSGDTLSAIAQRFGVSLQDLLEANPQIVNPNVLRIGQRICVPAPPPVVRRRRCLVLAPTDLTPRADGVALLDFGTGLVMLVAGELPAPAALGGDVYRAWLRVAGTDNWLPVELSRNPAGLWSGRRVVENLDRFDVIRVSAEAEANRERPVGPAVLVGELAEAR